MQNSRLTTLAFLGLLAASSVARGDNPPPFVKGLKNPESVCLGPDKRIYASIIGQSGKDGDGSVVVIQDGKAVPLATGLDDPKGLVAFGKWLFVTDKDKVIRIDLKGKTEVLVEAKDFPRKPLFLNDIESDGKGNLYVSDSGNLKEKKDGAVFKISLVRPGKFPGGKKIALLKKPTVEILIDDKKLPALKTPNGLLMDGEYFLLLADFGSGVLYRINLDSKVATRVTDGFLGADGLAWDHFGRLYISSWSQGKMWVIPRPGQKAVQLPVKFESAADICLSKDGRSILVPDMKAGTVTAVPIGVPGMAVDERPLPIRHVQAFPKLKWTGWTGESKSGKPEPLRPIVLTHGGDGTNRVFVATQRGVIHVFPNDQKATKTKVFLDIRSKVAYNDRTNEEGFLGMAFHPNFKKNGEFFVYYTSPKKKLPMGGHAVNIVARYRVSKDDPNKADPASEEIILELHKPFWNHDGGTLVFGPDGYLYIAVGDGGLANDPFGNGQNLNSLLGKILRIDINSRAGDRPYAIPKDNPFRERKAARPEVYAYGLRNVWRMAFDKKTGKLWAGDVGQNLYEEIDLIVKGGNYGWNVRESYHPFSKKGVDVRSDLIEPIWEYHHEVGKSITGGSVYRGKRLPELEGLYVYADYVTNKIWGLSYDEKQKRVVANRPIQDSPRGIFSFGEDERGEIYFLIESATGAGVYWFDRKPKAGR